MDENNEYAQSCLDAVMEAVWKDDDHDEFCGGANSYKTTDGKVVFLTQAELYHHRGPAFAHYSQLEFECIVQLQEKVQHQEKAELSNKSSKDRGRKPRPTFALGINHPLYASHVGVIRTKMCTPMFAGAPPPKFPGNRPTKDESSISKWNKDMIYYSRYLMDLCVPWLEESSPLFERSTSGFCSLMSEWNKTSATFIERQRFRVLSNFMMKRYRSSHNETAASAWQQQNADWWSEMKKTNHNIHHPENSPTNSYRAMDTDDEAAGRLRSTDLHRIIVAALEGHEKKPLHYHALRNNYTSLMCASYMANHPYENLARSPIFKQQNIHITNNLDGDCFSLTKMRLEIHKLKPEDLEETIIEKPTTHPGTNGPTEIQIGDQRGVSTLRKCMDETYRILLSISQAMFTKKQFQYLIDTMELYHFTDEQWNNLKAILTDNKDGFTDDQWKMVNHLLSQNRLNDEQFGIFVDMLDTSTQKLVFLHAGGGTGKTFVTCKIFEELAKQNEICHCTCPTGVGASHLPQGRTFHSVFKTWTPSLSAGTAIDEIFKSLGGNQLKMVVVDEVSMLSTQFLVLLDTRL
jgi:hypothetical protein